MNLTPEQMANGRRNFLKMIAGVPAVAALGAIPEVNGPGKGGKVRVGFIGVGGQGRALTRLDHDYADVRRRRHPAWTRRRGRRDSEEGTSRRRSTTRSSPRCWSTKTSRRSSRRCCDARDIVCLNAGKHVLCEKMMAKTRDG